MVADAVLKTPIPYFGAKQLIAEKIVALMPPHKGYVEPFAGSLSVLLAKAPTKIEIVNDLDQKLMTFWRVLRDNPDELVRMAELTPHSRGELEAAMLFDAEDDLHLAWQVWVLLTQGRSRALVSSGWRHYIDPNGTNASFQTYMRAYRLRLPGAASRIRDVTLECRDAFEVIEVYGRFEDNLLYIDPPYLGSSRHRGGRYGIELSSEADHRRLSEYLHACKAKVMLSGYRSPLYDEIYGDWHRAEIRAYTGNGLVPNRSEIVWMNFDPPPYLSFAIAINELGEKE